MRAVRATLILIPLLGIQFVLLAYKPHNSRALEIYLYIMDILMHYQVCEGQRLLWQQPGPDNFVSLLFSSSSLLSSASFSSFFSFYFFFFIIFLLLLLLQGFLVSTIFCFFNGEVSQQHVPAECKVQVTSTTCNVFSHNNEPIRQQLFFWMVWPYSKTELGPGLSDPEL